VALTNFTREKFHAIGAVNGKREHYSFLARINTAGVLTFIKRLQACYPRLTLFLDGGPWHRTKRLTAWCEAHHVRLVKFPSYSPELNPIEQAWRTVKQATANSCYKNKHEFKKAVRHSLRVKNLTKMFKYLRT
jgi:transposase